MHDAFFEKITFAKSAPNIKYLPEDIGYEVAFLGRSNAGKSSAINTLVNKKALARTSKTPGRTAALNIFPFDDSRRLVDVPGFGYAKVSAATKEDWRHLINNYLSIRECLKGVVLVMDIRHPLRPHEENLLSWLVAAELPVHVILTKADKLKYGEKKRVLSSVVKHISSGVSVSLFSSKSKEGVDNLRIQLAKWYEI